MLIAVIMQNFCDGSGAWVELVAVSWGDMRPQSPQYHWPGSTSLCRAGLAPNACARDGWFMKCYPCSRDTIHVPGWPGNGIFMRRIHFLQHQELRPHMWRCREMSKMFQTPKALLLIRSAHLQMRKPLSCVSQDTLSQTGLANNKQNTHGSQKTL